MSGSSDYEQRKKLNKIREDVNKRVKDVRDHFAKIEKVKVEALKKTEEMKLSAEKDIAKLERDIAQSVLPGNMKQALTVDVTALKKEIEERAAEFRDRISRIATPS